MYTLKDQIHDAEQDLLDDQNVLELAEQDLENQIRWVESRKQVVEQDKIRIAKLKSNE